jgi:isopropylmalate/homocitrate/citramalate synthase
MEKPYFKEDGWWVSPFNFIGEVRRTMELPKRVLIHDATLRDGEQTPGVVFRKEDKIEIAKKLDEVGVDRIEAGMPAVSSEDFEAIESITGLGLKAKIFSFVRALSADIDKSVECGAQGVVLEIPIGYPKLIHQFRWNWEDVLRKSVDTIQYARKRGLYLVYFPYDTTRAREDDLENLLTSLMREAPPDSIGVVDTMGCALPEAIKYLVRKVKSLTGLPVEIHTHNDFGMAVATELAAVSAGAEVVHSCVNGLGERTGNAALEELILGLELLLGFQGNYRMDRIMPLSRLVADLSGVLPADNKPVIGERNYTRESGIGVDLVEQKPLAMFATDPKLTGRKGKVVLGKKSGKASIEYILAQLGIKGLSGEQVGEILGRVKSWGIEKRALVTIEEFQQILGKVTGISIPPGTLKS